MQKGTFIISLVIQDIILIEKIQHRATKYILNDCYRTRLIKLSLLLVMYIFELNDIIFLISTLKRSSTHFQITNYISFNTGVTRSSSLNKLIHKCTRLNSDRHFYFNRIPRLWNALPPINLSLSLHTIKMIICGQFSYRTLTLNNPCTFHFYVHVVTVAKILLPHVIN